MLLENLHVFLYITAVLYAGLTAYAISRPPNVVNREIALLMLVCTIWVYSYTQEMNTYALGLKPEAQLEVMRAWTRVRFMTLPFLVPLWLALVASISGYARFNRWRVLGAVAIIPLVVSILSTTPGLQVYFRRSFTISEQPRLLDFEYGPMGRVYIAYVVAGIALGIGMVAVALWRYGARRDLRLLLVSSVIPLTHFMIITHPSARGVTMAPALLLPMAVALILASVRYNLCDLAPFVARRQFFERALEGVVILDTASAVLDYNTAAADGFQMVGLGNKLGMGKRLGPGWMPEPWDAVFLRDGDAKMTFKFDRKDADGAVTTLWYERTRAPVAEKGVQLAWLFTIADITDRMALQAREADEIRQSSEAARVRQWHGLLRDLHDGIGPVSTTIGLLAERALRAKGPAEKDDLLGQISNYAENGHVELRTLMNMMEYKRMAWADILVETRRFSRMILEPRGIGLKVEEEGVPPAKPPSVTYATSLLRIIKEAVHNTAKHSGATETGISFAFMDNILRLTVRDNGTWRESETEGRGLRHIRQRVAELNGSMVIQTTPETRLTCVLPVTSAETGEHDTEPGEIKDEYLHCRG